MKLLFFFVAVQLLSLLLEALTYPDQGVQLSTLSCLQPVLVNPPSVLIQQLEALVNRLLALTSSPAMVSEIYIYTVCTYVICMSKRSNWYQQCWWTQQKSTLYCIKSITVWQMSVHPEKFSNSKKVHKCRETLKKTQTSLFLLFKGAILHISIAGP